MLFLPRLVMTFKRACVLKAIDGVNSETAFRRVFTPYASRNNVMLLVTTIANESTVSSLPISVKKPTALHSSA